MVDQDEFSGWERVDMLPDGRYLLADSQKGTRVADADFHGAFCFGDCRVTISARHAVPEEGVLE
jgi:hypothetical protein